MYEHVQNLILSWGYFCLNYCSNAAWHWVNQSVALLRCYGSPGFSDSGLQLFCIVGSGISHLPLHNTPYIFMGLRSGEFAGQLRTGIPWSLNRVLVALALFSGAKSCWKMKSASPCRPNNAEERKATIRATLASITPQQCHRLIDSMPRCVAAVIQAKGAPTKYWVLYMLILFMFILFSWPRFLKILSLYCYK